MMIRGVNHITIAVSDLERSLRFYCDLLGLRGQVRWDGGAYLTLGELWICLSCDAVRPSGDYCHLALDLADADFAACCDALRAAGVVEWKQNRSEGASFYFLDPDGHKLELHCGTLASRLASLRQHPYPGLTWL